MDLDSNGKPTIDFNQFVDYRLEKDQAKASAITK